MKNNKNMKFLKWMTYIFAAITLVSCYPEYDKDIIDYDVVITMKNDSTFNSDEGQKKISTYFLADTIIHVGDTVKNELDPEFPRDYDQVIIDAIVQNLYQLGYERVDSLDQENTPDVLVSISALALRNTVVYTYQPGYWWGGNYWYDYWWGYPGYGYPWYPAYYTGYSYNKGSVFIDMVSSDQTASDDQQIVSEWTGIYNGLLYEDDISSEERISTSIDKLFDKSPYLEYIN